MPISCVLQKRRFHYVVLITVVILSIGALAIYGAEHGHNPDRLRSVPGIGKVLALTILYEIHDITRFDRVQEFASYARLIKCTKESGSKKLGTGGPA